MGRWRVSGGLRGGGEEVVDGLEEEIGVAGFEEDVGDTELGELCAFGGVVGAAEDEDFKAGVDDAEGADEFEAGHDGHHDVGEDEADGVVVLDEDAEGFLAVGGSEDAVVMVFEAAAGGFAEEVFVVNEEDEFAVSAGGGVGGLSGLVGGGGIGGGEVDFEDGAAAGGAVDGDAAAVVFNDGLDGGEAEAGTLVGAFGGEEGVEDAGEDFGGNAGAGVGDAEDDIAAGG